MGQPAHTLSGVSVVKGVASIGGGQAQVTACLHSGYILRRKGEKINPLNIPLIREKRLFVNLNLAPDL